MEIPGSRDPLQHTFFKSTGGFHIHWVPSQVIQALQPRLCKRDTSHGTSPQSNS